MKIAIIEDVEQYAALLKSYLMRFGEEHNHTFKINLFSNAIAFLEPYSADYDLIFMDIHMPYMNGMDAARKLREIDKNVLLIFVTNLTQYAINGYEVEALDYILKPIGYYDFALKMSRAMQKIPTKDHSELLISTANGIIKIRPTDIYYIESSGHHVFYHLKGKIYKQNSSLSAVESTLKPYPFARCNNCYLVNMRYVECVKGYTVTVAGQELQISQPRKKTFIQQLVLFTEGKKI